MCVCCERERKSEPQVSPFYVQEHALPKQVLKKIESVGAGSKHCEAILAAGSISQNHVFISHSDASDKYF